MIEIETLNKAIELTQQRNYKEAEKLYLELLEQEPNDNILLSAIGLFYINLRDFNNATIYLERACKVQESLGTVSALGIAEYERGDFEKAAKILEHALTFGENENVYNKLVLSLFRVKNYTKAIEYTEKMYKLYPTSVKSISNMVKAYTQSGKLLEAEKICVEYLKENNDAAGLWFHLGYLKELIYCDDKQAFECYRIASELGSKEAYYNMAVSCQKRGDFTNAEIYYNKMLEEFPNHIDTITSLGMCKLAQKKFKEGYDLFYLRKNCDETNKLWNPKDGFDAEIIVVCDQGFGDHIQFVRYLPFLKEKVKNFSVACRKSLIELFSKNYPEVKFISIDEINPDTQSIRITDLAYALTIDFEHIPFSKGYLNCEPAKIESDKLKVGLCWEAGSAAIRTMINRTINIRLLEPIINLKTIQVYSFQVNDSLKGNEKYPQMINLAKDFNNFEDTAKALKSMDVVITVDTSVAHLAGALGVKTFLMLPYATDWRWFNDTKTTPWYDSIEIFKQTDPISWEQPIGDIICKINEFSS